jgi:hypothetical protein
LILLLPQSPKTKRKADDAATEGIKAEKKAKKEFSDPNIVLAAPKIKAVQRNKEIDLDRQCGVNNEGGAICARSLTCKNHSLAAKKAVIGR